ncbi:MAG: extracellular solute-binding protein [Turicibacter sp.]|nr:extracellular solute-binding protein [Turicibacter sp.]
MKKFLSLFGVLLLAVVFLAACDDDTDNGYDDDNGEVADASAEDIRLVVPYLGLTDEQIEAAESLGEMDTPYNRFMYGLRREAESAMADQGAEVEFVDWGWAESLDQQQRALIAAGDAPDIVVGEIFMPTYAAEDILLPLPQDIVDAVNPSFLVFNDNDQAVAVAARASVFSLFYNRDLLEAAGFDSAPTTWDEFQMMSDAITEAGNGEFFGGGVPSFPHAGGALRATPFFRQMGTDFIVDGELQLESQELIETLYFIRAMNHNLPLGLGNSASEDPMWNAFEVEQNIAFVINGTWQAGGAERNDMNWGVAPLPLPAGGVEGNCLVAAMYMAVPRGASHPELSFDIIRLALSENLSEIWLDDSVPSPRQDIIDHTARWSDNETLAVAIEAVSTGEVSGLATFPQNDAQIWEIINTQILARTTMTNDPIATIVAEASAQIQSLLD